MARTVRSSRSYTLSPTGKRTNLDKVYVGFVKDVRDIELMGRIKVYIPELSPDPNDEKFWITATYCSPFAGASPIGDVKNDSDKFNETQKSYGFWFPPPDIDNEVVLAFINGDPARCIWFGCLFQQRMNNMVPGIPSNPESNENRDEENPPLSEYNKKSDVNQFNPERPLHTPLTSGLRKQGLIKDNTRGTSSSSARRESPSRAMGILTPRGNQFVIDDGFTVEENQIQSQEGGINFSGDGSIINPAHEMGDPGERQSEFFRIRTRSGTQILVSETHGMVYIITRDGNSWAELNNDGFIDLYAVNDVSVRSESNINFRADRDVNIEAGRNINIKASKDFQEGDDDVGTTVSPGSGSDGGGNITVEAWNDYHLSTKEGSLFEKAEVDHHILAKTGEIFQQSNGDTSHRAGGLIRQTGRQIHQNTGGAPAKSSTESNRPETREKIDKDFVRTGEYKDTRLETIVERLPQHEPYEAHSIITAGTNRYVIESSEDDPESSSKNVPAGSNTLGSDTPLNVIGSFNGNTGVFEGVRYNKGNPVYKKIGNAGGLLNDPRRFSTGNGGVGLIKNYEGFRSNIYRDAASLPTIGYGHRLTADEISTGKININGRPVNISKGLTKNQADMLLRQDIKDAERSVRNNVKTKITQNQFDSLVSFTYNVGGSNLSKSTLLKEINNNNFKNVPNEMLRWTKARVNGKQTVLNGLVSRRREESLLFSRT